MTGSETIAEYLKKISPFRDLNPQTRLALAQAARVVKVESKQILFSEGDAAEAAFILMSGRIALIKASPNGKELIVELLSPGDPFALIVAQSDRPYPVTAKALSAGSVLYLPRQILNATVANNPGVLRQLLDVISSRIRHSHEFSRALAHDRIEVRMAATLLSLLPTADPHINTSNPAIISLSRQELADVTGVTLETASRMAKKFEEDGAINLSTVGKIHIVDAELLKSYLT